MSESLDITVGEIDYALDDEEYEYLAIPEVDEDYLDDIKADTAQVLNKVPFTKIHDVPVPYDSTKRRCFMPGQKVHVKIVDVEHTDTGLFNPNFVENVRNHGQWYVIELTHGEYKWTIRRRYKHFKALHDSLVLFKAKIAVAVPTKNMRQRRKSFAQRKHNLPKFPKTPEPLVRNDNIQHRKEQLESYLQNLLRFPQFRNHEDTLKFLEVSHLTFVNGLGGKWREGMMKKRTGGRRIQLKMCGCCPTLHCTATWNSRWLLLKDTFLAYINPKSGATGDVILMDKDFSVQSGMFHTGVSHGLLVSNLSRNLLMKCETHRQADEWLEDIQRSITEKGQDFVQPNRYNSFAPVRPNSYVDWFVDAANYMAAVGDALETAKEEIFITDWWLSPELYLKRPVTPNQEWRLDLLLKKKAEQGVHVYILVFKELELALGLNSYYTKQTLVRQHPNIKVMRHPDGITLWSHHEKIVCIDQRIAFLGGIDLCFGRWDTKAHRLTDLGKATMHPFEESVDDEWLDVIHEEGDAASHTSESEDNTNTNNRTSGSDDNTNTNNNQSRDESPSADSDQGTTGDNSVFISDHDGTSTIQDVTGSSNPNNRTLYGDEELSLSNSSKPLHSITSSPSGDMMTSVDLNCNNSGNGEDAVRKQKQLSDHERQLAAHVLSQKTKFKVNDEYEFERETEESDVEMDADIRSKTSKKTKHQVVQSAVNNSVKPDHNGSYANPGMEQIINDEAGSSHKEHHRTPRSSVQTNRALSKEERIKNRLSGHGQLGLHDKSDQNIIGASAGNEKQEQVKTLSGQGHLGLNGPYRGLNGTELGKHNHNSDLSVVVASSGAYWKICDNSGNSPSSHSKSDICDNERTVDSSHVVLGVPSTSMPAGNPQPAVESDVPSIQVTDTSRAGRPQKPILRNIERQPKIDLGGSDDSPSKEKNIHDQFDVTGQILQNVALFHSGKPRPHSSPQPVRKKQQSSEPKRPTDKTPSHKKTYKQDSVTSSTSETSDISLEGVFEGGSGGTDPSSFKAYLMNMMTQALEVDNAKKEAETASPRPASTFETGPAGIFLRQYVDKQKDNNDNKVNKAAMTTPPRGRKTFRPPKLSLGMKHFNKGSKAMDSDTAASLADTGGRLPSPTKDTPRAPRFTLRSDTPSFEELTTRAPKPTTPKSKKKQLDTYDIKERFRKNKMMSIDVTDDVTPKPWADSTDGVEHPSKLLYAHEVLEQEGREEEVRFWIGKDYANFIYKDFVDLDQPFSDMVDRTETPRMPWHDIGCVVAGKAARDAGRHFIQRWNYTKLTKQKQNTEYPMLVPKSYDKVSLPQWIVSETYRANCQIVRSSCEWSAGIKTVESSIHEAYIDLILKSKHYIYIENQFFVTVMNHDTVENRISTALYERILDAHKKGETFRVYVVMPLLPAFEGELGTNTGTSIQAVTHYNYQSICRGGKSLLEMLTKDITDPFEYISFYGLRTYDQMPKKLASELVYVHSKLMIVDDKSVIMGSANINDRSLLGKRDSEIAIVIEDTTNLITTTFDGKQVQVGKFASDLRKNIFREHLGVSDKDPVIDVSDPISTSFYKGVWLRQASINTSVFEKVFNCMPTDKVQSYSQLKDYQKETALYLIRPDKAEKMLKKIQGTLVLMPLLFLAKENLGNMAGTKEGLLPQIVWT